MQTPAQQEAEAQLLGWRLLVAARGLSGRLSNDDEVAAMVRLRAIVATNAQRRQDTYRGHCRRQRSMRPMLRKWVGDCLSQLKACLVELLGIGRGLRRASALLLIQESSLNQI